MNPRLRPGERWCTAQKTSKCPILRGCDAETAPIIRGCPFPGRPRFTSTSLKPKNPIPRILRQLTSMADLRLALRLLWKDKTFALTAAVTLAVCMAANVALFAVVDHVLLRSLRIPESDRVLLAYNSYPKAGANHAGATIPDLFDRLSSVTVFEEQALFNTRNPGLDVHGTSERIH